MKHINELVEALEHTFKTVPETEIAEAVLGLFRTHLDIKDVNALTPPCHSFKLFAFKKPTQTAKSPEREKVARTR